MTIQEQILSELVQAMKQRDAAKLSVLRMVKAGFIVAAKEKPKDAGDMLTDEEVIGILKREAKKRKESAAAFTAGNREELAAKEREELAMIQAYLPAQLSEEEVRTVVMRAITEKGASNFGAVMGAAMEQLKGKADGNVVRSVVNACLKP